MDARLLESKDLRHLKSAVIATLVSTVRILSRHKLIELLSDVGLQQLLGLGSLACGLLMIVVIKNRALIRKRRSVVASIAVEIANNVWLGHPNFTNKKPAFYVNDSAHEIAQYVVGSRLVMNTI